MAEPSQAELRQPLPYHAAIRDYLKTEEPRIWEWYASNRVREEQDEAIRFDLLKSTYRIDRAARSDLYEAADKVAEELALEAPITIYQAQNPVGLNASLAFTPGEAHIVLHGPIVSKLSANELRSLLAHELGHMLLYSAWDGEFLIVEQVLAAMTHDRDADTPHFCSARLFGLYTEVFCDRVALGVVGSPLDVISTLVKVSTELDEVDPSSYLQQAEEVLGKGPVKTEGITHPEAYIRAHSLQLWHEKGAEAGPLIARLIEGRPELDELDLTAQVRVMGVTRRLIDAVLAPRWIQTDVALAHARLYFDDYQPPTEKVDRERLCQDTEEGDDALHDYFCYVLLDFASADRDLEEAPLAHAIGLAESLGLEERFSKIAAKELRMRKKQMEKIANARDKIVAAAEKEGATP